MNEHQERDTSPYFDQASLYTQINRCEQIVSSAVSVVSAEVEKIAFSVVGIVTSPEFQKCRIYAERLHRSYPDYYSVPVIRPLLDLDWELFLTKVRRRAQNPHLWALKKDVAVFQNNHFLGDDEVLINYIKEIYNFTISRDFKKIGCQQLHEMVQKESDLGRSFVYLSIAIDGKLIGTLLFLLYNDLVPDTCEHFLKLCTKLQTYVGKSVQRIVRPSWIQLGGHSSKQMPKSMACENYMIHHDRRGVLSMCHGGKHKDNTTQFFVTLDSTPWMDYKYVGFGQLLHGANVLKAIENVPTYYEAPLQDIRIVKTGEFTFYPEVDTNAVEEIQKYIDRKATGGRKVEGDVVDVRDVGSDMMRGRYKAGLYFYGKDTRSYMPFLHLPDHLLYLYGGESGEGGEKISNGSSSTRKWDEINVYDKDKDY